MATKKYKHPAHRCLWPLFAAVGTVVALLAIGSDDAGQSAAQATAGLLLAVSGVLMARTGLTAAPAGLTVRSTFSTKVVPWEQIDRFDLEDILVIRLTNGKAVRYRAIHPVGLYTPTRDGYAHQAVGELNTRLARLTRSGRKR